jgi:hypothetical protein
VPKGEGSERLLARAAGFCLLLACSTVPWPDEPGVPVAVSQVANVDAGETFLTLLTERRRQAGLPPPLVTPRYQSDIRKFADDLQSGKVSASGVRRAIESWGHAAYQREVETWILDCGPGEKTQVPAALIELPSAVISYAAAHFHPRSLAREQCAILAISLSGTESLALPSL